ncbi:MULTISPECIES: DUF6708 domain-containing protein [unclassified Psychrobacter]|uniref:DUF6708 domain-containing protein n=1 Tax=unclassified Psychrobacter TaxID=196806 RepID=UPI0025B3AFEE|nr:MULTISPECIES: DUF6708 domain-containing protein [unclassified Psychrobacter]MDN3453444.1 hypothetical protein [Psychrobacter sp. APC 3350]MDN3503800.1 hypothetical protein [Psychrobacter sp. 5A.1]
MFIDLTGRSRNKTYSSIGKPYKEEYKAYHLCQDKHYGLPLRPQRTVVQFNSTYMELVDRWESARGEITHIQGAAFLLGIFGIFVCIYGLIVAFKAGGIAITIGMFILSIICFGILWFVIRILSRELFTYTYFPIRFNRKNGKVYVIGADKQVETYDWNALKIHMENGVNAPWDIRCCDVDDKGIIRRTFSFPFTHSSPNEFLQHHFEFVNAYMRSKTNKDIKHVADSIRHVFPIHQRKETLQESIERSRFEFHDRWKDMEYPETSLNIDLHYIAATPFWLLKLLGRIVSIKTCTTPHFSFEIEAECDIDPNDKFDLNKKPPNPPRREYSLLEKAVIGVLLIIGSIIGLSVFALFIDIMGAARPHGDYPSFFKILWDWLLFRWI